MIYAKLEDIVLPSFSKKRGDKMDEIEEIRQRELNKLYAQISSMKSENIKPENAKVQKITDWNFEEFIGKNRLAVVDCYATWCGPCRMLSPIIEELSKEFAGKISFGKLDVDDNTNVPARFGITSIPTILISKNGKVVDRLVGLVPKSQLKRILESYLQ